MTTTTSVHGYLERLLPTSLRWRLLLVTSFFTIALFFMIIAANQHGLPFGLLEGHYRQKETEAIRQMSDIADDKKEQISRWFKERQGDLRTIVDYSDFRNHLLAVALPAQYTSEEVTRSSLLVKEKFELIAESYGYDSIELVDSVSGLRLFSTIEGLNNTESPVVKELFADGSDWNEMIFFSDTGSGNSSVIHFVRMVFFDTDELGSNSEGFAVVFNIPTAKVLSYILYSTGSLGRSGEVVLLDSSVRLLAPLKHPLRDGSRAKPLSYYISAEPAKFAASGVEGTMIAKDYRGEPVIAAIRHLRITPDFGLGMVVKMDQEEIFAPLRENLAHSTLLMLSGLAVLLVFLSFAASWQFGPLENLSEMARRIESGDFTARAEYSGKNEIGLMAGAFDNMANRIEHWHAELESMVEHRTNQLQKANIQLADEIDERKRAETEVQRLNSELELRVVDRTAQLEAANKELEAFSYSVSHDLRAPLRHIDGFIELLVSRCRDDLSEKGKHYVDIIGSSARQMSALIDDLLKFSRTGRADMHMETMDMNKVLHEALENFSESFSGRKIEWIIGELPAVHGDIALLRQVWANLLDNAIKYTRTREIARIEVSARKENGETIFSIKDNGVGFDMQYAGQLFGVFRRLHSEEEFEGTGIGLATVQRIVSRHGGRVWAVAELNRGATFNFTLSNTKEIINA
ncbi:MAG: HAMP domain-containing protein [Candidatus Riflebacteria bacterium]|nr:HAMP domain-containing protein [Candidatus Riflebacteria bacterium]